MLMQDFDATASRGIVRCRNPLGRCIPGERADAGASPGIRSWVTCPRPLGEWWQDE